MLLRIVQAVGGANIGHSCSKKSLCVHLEVLACCCINDRVSSPLDLPEFGHASITIKSLGPDGPTAACTKGLQLSCKY